MASQRSNGLDLIAGFQEAARRADWTSARQLMAALCADSPPEGQLALGEYIDRMKAALMVAKASRSHAAASLVRLTAAAGFNNTRIESTTCRQDYGE